MICFARNKKRFIMHSDNQLIRKIKKKNDRGAADELLGRYYREIYAFVWQQVRDRELAMDLTQDIFVAVLRGLHSFDERKAQFRTWLYRVASNKITDYYRSRYHRQRMMEEELRPESTAARTGGMGRADGMAGMTGTAETAESNGRVCADFVSDDFVDRILREETIQEIMDVVSQFDPVRVQIFQQRCFMDLTFREIAHELGLSENTVKTRYYAMIKQLRKELKIYE